MLTVGAYYILGRKARYTIVQEIDVSRMLDNFVSIISAAWLLTPEGPEVNAPLKG